MNLHNNENDIKIILSNNYNIHEIESINRVNTGYGSECYYISTNDNSYIFKLVERNPMSFSDEMWLVHEVLSNAGIPVSKLYTNINGQIITQYKEKDSFLQSYIKGKVFQQNTAPDWFMTESSLMLGRIHKALEAIPLLKEGMGESFLNCLKTDGIKHYYQDSLEIALTKGHHKIVSDIEYRLHILDHIKNLKFDLKKFTLKNTHGDYKIDQLICGDNVINGIIDIDACVHPIVWEIIRSYTYASPECINGNINIENMKRYVDSYLKVCELNCYDLKMMPYFYFFQLVVCNYFGQYYGMTHPNKNLLLDNAHWSTSLCRWFENNVQYLSDQLLAIF